MRLRLVVNNTDDLSGGSSAIKDFSIEGGTIGSSENSTWQIIDRNGSVQPTHATIRLIDNHFCLETSFDRGVKFNNARSYIPAHELAQLSDGDTITIGKFSITAYIEVSADETSDRWSQRFTSVGSIIDGDNERDITAQNFLETKTMALSEKIILRETRKREQEADPIALIEDNYQSQSTNEKDPVRLLDKDSLSEKNIMASKVDDIINVAPEEASQTVIPDDLQPGSEYIDMLAPKAVERDHYTATDKKVGNRKTANVDDDIDTYLETLQHKTERAHELRDIATRDSYLSNVEIDDTEDTELIDHVLLRPLCAAMGLNITKMSVPQADRLLADIGEAVRAAIQGLIDTQSIELGGKSHLSQTQLHAIEDNPLRLQKPVEDVIKDLFLIRNPVHLSAKSAIEESLSLIHYHKCASEVAINEALDAVLQSIAPTALAKRFKKYKGHAPRAGNLDAWHWEMYQYYYDEMRSEHQGGLGRMFWEVYAQVYDREMRKLTVEI